MNQQDMSNTAWSYARRELQDAPLINAIAAQALRKLSAVDSRSLSLIAWAVAKRMLGDGPLMTAIAAAALPLLSAAGPQGLSNTAWAFATRAVAHAPLCTAIASASLRSISQFGQQELSNIAWAFAELCFTDIPLMHAISAAALASLDGFCASGDSEEAARNSFALLWAQGRMSCPGLARQLAAGYVLCGRCHRLSFGLVIRDEEWQRNAPPDGALAALEATTGRSVGPPRHACSSIYWGVD